ncbi:MAG: hypothetical protein RDV41_02395, partial [Planctomycetota bacterium]|nr:hypothetical protein [Planctomycetota bacterium]
MSQREKDIAALATRIAELENQSSNEFVEMGKVLISSGYTGGRIPEVAAALEKSSALNAKVSQRRGEIRQIVDRLDQLKMIGETLRANERKVKTSQSEIEGSHKEIGKVAFEAYKTKCQDKDRYRETFEEVLRIEEEIDKKQKEIEAVETEGKTKGFFSRVKDKANIYLIKAAIVKTEMGRSSALSAVGAKVLGADFASVVADDSLGRTLEAPLGLKKTIAELTASSESLRTQQATTQSDLVRIVGSDQNPQGKVKEWEREVSAAEQEVASMFRSLGEQCHTHGLHSEIDSNDLKTHAKTVDQLGSEIAASRGQIESLRAAIELDRSVAECDGL